jgi:hypothetical protein
LAAVPRALEVFEGALDAALDWEKFEFFQHILQEAEFIFRNLALIDKAISF